MRQTQILQRKYMRRNQSIFHHLRNGNHTIEKILGKPHFTCDVHTGELGTSDVQAGFRKGRGTRGQIANIC